MIVNWKSCGRKICDVILGIIPALSCRDWERREQPRDRQCSCQDLNLKLPKYEAEMLTAGSRCSFFVFLSEMCVSLCTCACVCVQMVKVEFPAVTFRYLVKHAILILIEYELFWHIRNWTTVIQKRFLCVCVCYVFFFFLKEEGIFELYLTVCLVQYVHAGLV
jgi:hypothetical protein